MSRKKNMLEKKWVENAKKREDDSLDFQSWFDSATSIEDVTANAFLDFYYKILSYDVLQVLGNPKDKNAFEIGFGGGRLLCAAAKTFKKVYGVDIHNSFEKTKEYLNQNNVKEYRLFNFEELDQVEDESIDLIYSFICFQHFDSFETVLKYIKFIKRTLKSNGVCNIFFGYSKTFMHNKNVPYIEYTEEAIRNLENWEHTLCVNPEYIVQVLSPTFNIISCERSIKKAWKDTIGGQFNVVFNRP